MSAEGSDKAGFRSRGIRFRLVFSLFAGRGICRKILNFAESAYEREKDNPLLMG